MPQRRKGPKGCRGSLPQQDASGLQQTQRKGYEGECWPQSLPAWPNRIASISHGCQPGKRQALFVPTHHALICDFSVHKHTCRAELTSPFRAVRVEGGLVWQMQASAAKIGTIAFCGDVFCSRPCSSSSTLVSVSPANGTVQNNCVKPCYMHRS